MRKVRGLRPGPPACYYFASAVASGAGAADDVGAGSEVAAAVSAVAVESPPGVSVVGVELPHAARVRDRMERVRMIFFMGKRTSGTEARQDAGLLVRHTGRPAVAKRLTGS